MNLTKTVGLWPLELQLAMFQDFVSMPQIMEGCSKEELEVHVSVSICTSHLMYTMVQKYLGSSLHI